MVSELLDRVVTIVCPYGSVNQFCIRDYEDRLTTIVNGVLEQVCSGGDCPATISALVDDVLATVGDTAIKELNSACHGYDVNSDVAHCESQVLQTLSQLYGAVTDDANNTLDSVCGGSGDGVSNCAAYATDLVPQLVNFAIGEEQVIVNGVMSLACQSTNLNRCEENIINKVNAVVKTGTDTLTGVLNNLCGGYDTNSDLAYCEAWLLKTIQDGYNLAYDTANKELDAVCGGSGDGVSNCYAYANYWSSYYINWGLAEARSLQATVMNVVCQSPDTGQCENNLVNKVNQTISTAISTANGALSAVCGAGTTTSNAAQNCQAAIEAIVYRTCGTPLPTDSAPAAGTVTGVDPAVAQCMLKVLRIVGFAMTAACQTTDPGTCLGNLETIVLGLIHTGCRDIPSGATSGSFDGVFNPDPCTDKLVQLVYEAMGVACQSTYSQTCEQNLINKVEGLLHTACNDIPSTGPTSGSLDGVFSPDACTTKVVLVVYQVMYSVCTATNIGQCETNVINKVEKLVHDTCDGLPNVGPSTGSLDGLSNDACIVKVIHSVYFVMSQTCRSTDTQICVNNILEEVAGYVNGTCSKLPPATNATTSADVTSVCISRVIEIVDDILVQKCGSSDGPTCATNLLQQVVDLFNQTCANFPPPTDGATAPSSTSTDVSNECIVKVVEIVDNILVQKCGSTDGPTCATNLLQQVVDLFNQTCANFPPPTDGATAPSSTSTDVSNECIVKVVEIVDNILVQKCGSTDGPTCATNLINAANDAVAAICATSLALASADGTSVTTVGGPSAIPTCANRALKAIYFVLQQACATLDGTACAQAAIESIVNAIEGLCAAPFDIAQDGSGLWIDGVFLPAWCASNALVLIQDDIAARCDSTAAVACITTLLDTVDDVIDASCLVQLPADPSQPNDPRDCLLSPADIEMSSYFEDNPVGTRVTVSFTAYDGFDHPYTFPVPWTVHVDGPNGPADFGGTLSATGTGQFSYAGTVQGSDQIVVSVGSTQQGAVRTFGPEPDDMPTDVQDDPGADPACGDCLPTSNLGLDGITIDDFNFLLSVETAEKCPKPNSKGTHNCVNESVKFNDDDRDGAPDGKTGGEGRANVADTWASDAMVDMYGCSHKISSTYPNYCKNYKYKYKGDKHTNPGYYQRVAPHTGIQRSEIFPGAVKVCPYSSAPASLRSACSDATNGKVDVGIVERFQAGPGQWYRAFANGAITNSSGQHFKVRLTVVADDASGSQVGHECNATFVAGADNDPGVDIRLPDDNAVFAVALEYRAHIDDANPTGQSGSTSGGIANLYHVRFLRINPPDPSRVDSSFDDGTKCAIDAGY